MINEHYKAIAIIIGGSLQTSTKLQAVINALSDYFSSKDENFNSEKFKSDALNGDYIKATTDEIKLVTNKSNPWTPAQQISVRDRNNTGFEDAMDKMTDIITKTYGGIKIKR